MLKRRGLRTAAFALLAVHLAVALAGFLAPYDEAAQNRGMAFSPPTPLRLTHWKLFAGGAQVHFFVRGSRHLVFGLVPWNIHLFGVDEPSRIFLAGSDGYGRDQFSRILYGSQISLTVGLLATALSLLIGAAAGLLAGYYGGWRDETVMRLAEFFLGLPWLYLLLAIRAFLPLTLNPKAAFLGLFTVIGVLGWARPARLIRSVVLSVKERPYVLSARGFGASDSYLIRRHILPEVYSILATQGTLLAPQYILAEVTLSYLGLGMGEPAASLGTMLASFRELSVIASYWWMALPGVALLPVFYAYYRLAQGLQNGNIVQ